MSCKHDMHPYESRTFTVMSCTTPFRCIFCEVEQLRAEVARMRPIVEAAVKWRAATHTGDANCMAGDCDDCDARVAAGELEATIDAAKGEP